MNENIDDKQSELRQYKGVKGWLRFFCFSLIILVPLFYLFTSLVIVYAVYIDRASGLYYTYNSGLEFYVIFNLSLGLFMTIYSVIAGIKLYRVSYRAVEFAKTYLVISLIGGIVASLFQSCAISFESLIPLVIGVLQSIISFNIWFKYLTISKRVKATYYT